MIDFLPYIRKATFSAQMAPLADRHPFTLPAVRCLDQIVFDKDMTILVGEVGSGKSTIMEGIAIAAGFNAEGGSRNFNFSTALAHSDLHKFITLSKSPLRPRDGFFFRAESYFNLASNIEALDKEFSFGPPIINSYGRRSLHHQSHGESFLALVTHRFGGHGLYLLDEPEAALSPSRQLVLLRRMRDLARLNSQFIIATHSPILMAYPGARIYLLSDNGAVHVQYEETEHYLVTKHFMTNRSTMLAELLGDK